MKKALLTILAMTPPLFAQNFDWDKLTDKTAVTENKAPRWIKTGAYTYRVATPDDPDILPTLGEGFEITHHLFDGSIRQIPIVMGLIGDDHHGGWNWDGAWPYWGRVTFRAGSWEKLSGFAKVAAEEYDTRISFHLNLTDVNIGLREFPETREFFQKLVETKSIYRRDFNPASGKNDLEPAYVPEEIDKYISSSSETPNPIEIFALVNYKNYWDSGLAKKSIDELYAKLPYPPPILYLDVLNTGGGNFNTGFPTGKLGGSRETQLEGIRKIAEYLYSKGTDLGTEGDRPEEAGSYGTYSWLHSHKGYSEDDYSVIAGAAKGPRAVLQQLYGNTGSFAISAIASTPGQIEKIRAHYALLLAGKPSDRKMPGLDTWHISDRGQDNDDFNIWSPPGRDGGGDPFRGDWIDLVNNFYLSGIQELYHIGKGNYRTATFQKIGQLHIEKYGITDPSGKESFITTTELIPADAPDWLRKSVMTYGRRMLEGSVKMTYNAPEAGAYQLSIYGGFGRGMAAANIYANGELQATRVDLEAKGEEHMDTQYNFGTIQLNRGENEISVDTVPSIPNGTTEPGLSGRLQRLGRASKSPMAT